MRSQKSLSQIKVGPRFFVAVLALIVFIWSIGLSGARASGSLPLAGVNDVALDTSTSTATDTATATATDTATTTSTATTVITGTATSTSTVTPTPTNTGTATQTGTATSSPTITLTPTNTGTPTITPTPTRTGTITPAPAVTISVSPSSAKVNESLTFTIVVKNNGTAPAVAANLSNAFPAYIDITSATTTKGIANRASHALTVTIGDLAPNETVTISVVVKVNASATRTETISNLATLTYNNNLQANGSVNYSVIATTTLPNTGEISLDAAPRPLDRMTLILFLCAGLIAAVGLLWKTRLASARFFALLLGLVFFAGALAACLPSTSAPQPVLPALPPATNTPTLMPFRPAYEFSTPEALIPTLPVFPIPSPTLSAPVEPGQPVPDTSAVQRIVVPALNLDTEVKYVPFEELSWFITGLRQEVAWLGGTSWPGLGGNTVLAAHITVAGMGDGPFRWLENLKDGDVITLYTNENVYTYVVKSQIIVEATDLGITQQTVNPQLTLITCTGWDPEIKIYRYRRAVFADLTRTEPWVRTAMTK